MPFYNRVRLPIYFSQPQFPIERNIFRRADGSRQVLTAVISNTYEGKTDQLPQDWHRKLVIALSHDVVNIEGVNFLTEVVLDSDYGIDWEEFLDKPIAQANFTVQVTPFNATNSNCSSCDEMVQLDLADDTTADCFEEGTDGEFPFSVFDNDSICCYPYVASISSFNTTYFDAVAIDQDGIVTFEVKDSVPNISPVLLATYRVTCPNGAYDEANIYICIEGTDTECVAPQNVVAEVPPEDGTVATLIWDPVLPTPVGYNWWLYAADDIYTVLDSGTTTDNFVNFSGLTPGEEYLFAVQTDCGGDTSDLSTEEFTTSFQSTNPCGSFLISFIPPGPEPTANYSYMDCNAQIQNGSINNGTVQHCMLANEFDEPIFFSADNVNLTIDYLEPC